MKLTLVGFIFIYEKVRIFVLNKSRVVENIDQGEDENGKRYTSHIDEMQYWRNR